MKKSAASPDSIFPERSIQFARAPDFFLKRDTRVPQLRVFLLEWIPETAAIRKCNRQSNRHKYYRKSNRQIVISYQLLSHVPGTFFIFTKAPKLHGIADHIDTIHAGKQQRENNRAHPLDSRPEGCLAAHLDAPRLLRMLDLGKIRLYVRDVAQRDGNGVAHVVADTHAI